MGLALHLTEGVVPSGVVRLPVVEGFVETGEHALGWATLAFFKSVDELISAALKDLDGAFDAENEQGEPGKSEDQADQGNHQQPPRVSPGAATLRDRVTLAYSRHHSKRS